MKRVRPGWVAWCLAGVWLAGCDVGLPPVPAARGEQPEPEERSDVEVRLELAPEDASRSVPPDRTSPRALYLFVQRIQLSRDPGCSDPVEVYNTSSPAATEVGEGRGDALRGAAPPGRYPCVIVTVDDYFVWFGHAAETCGYLVGDSLHAEPGVEKGSAVLHLTTADPGTEPELDGRVVYPLESPWTQTGSTHRGRLLVDATGRIDADSCRFVEAPSFRYLPG